MQNYLMQLSRSSKRLIMLASDAVLLPFALWSAIALRIGDWSMHIDGLYWALFNAQLVAIPVFVNLGLYRAVIRYMEGRVVLTVLKGVTLSVLLLVVLNLLAGIHGIPRSSYVIYWGIALLYIGGSRMMARAYFRKGGYGDGKGIRQHVAIYGAGETGVKLVSALHTGHHFEVVAFFDDDADLHGSGISGVTVYHPSFFPELLESKRIGSVLLAIPSATHKRRNEIIRELSRFKVSVRTIPTMRDLMSGAAKIDEIKEVDIEDLLGRDSVQPIPHLIGKCIAGKSVMVTGAGGSIGAELCRQIMLQEPKRLVLFEKSEFALYQIESELDSLKVKYHCTAEIIPILGSVTHQGRVERVIDSFGVQTIYHAAAYKHVPLVEHNLIEGVVNNVFGTWRTAEAARKMGVETFVLISTDKAVRPTNVMGASKRFSELVLQAFAHEGGVTRFCMVRFGNVLGSSGSVVPLFKKQIQEGGPVTVTHPEITRFFMTIPEAAGLVLQAGAMGKGGDVFVLDMGSPMKIVDLARKMIHLSGLEVRDEEHPEGEIAIEYSGLRPGEKLYEELLIGEDVTGTEHPLIMRAEEQELPWASLEEALGRLDSAFHQADCEAVRNILLEVVEGYRPQGGICDYVWEMSHSKIAVFEKRVVNFPSTS